MSDDKLEEAARVDDPIEHSPSTLAKMAGFAAGIVVGAALVMTAPVSLTVGGVIVAAGTVAGAASLGGLFGGLAGQVFGEPYEAGVISTGAETVFVGGGPLKRAARVEDMVDCHDDKIATGCLTIFIEGKNATRATEETRCAGTIKDEACSPNVFYGGPSVRLLTTRYHGEEPAWFFWLDMAAGALSGRSTLRLVPLAATSAPRFHQWYRRAEDIAQAYDYYRGGPVRQWTERGAAVVGALGNDEGANQINDTLNRVTPEGVIFPPQPPPP